MAHSEEIIHFILTGGTIDSYYNAVNDSIKVLPSSCIPYYIKHLNLYTKVKYTEVCMKDSRELTTNELNKILKAIEKSSCKNIIITHGTYTMSDTARYLKANLKRKDQSIIFTGSMIPLTGFIPSDAPFNLGFTIAKIQEFGPGIWVSMNGRIFDPEEVAKVISEGRFVSLFSND